VDPRITELVQTIVAPPPPSDPPRSRHHHPNKSAMVAVVAVHIHALVFELASMLPARWMRGMNPHTMIADLETIWHHMHPHP